MDFDEEYEEQEEQAHPQAQDMEIDEQDVPYLELRTDRERQAYAMLKNHVF